MSLFCEHINKNEKRFNSLIEKYNVPAPRYTSYPTVPYWDNASVTQEEWKELVKDSFLMNNRTDGLSIYIHLPFCESLCTYCGCNTRITVNHKVESPYIRALLTEWAMYIDLFETTPRIRQIHLGGGTPTFFSPANLTALLEGILASAVLTKNAELSFEAHPANTTVEHLKVLYNFGFTRLSLGIQDFDEAVQKCINRKQSYEQVNQLTQQARAIGYESVNYDLIYGLPLQTRDTVKKTIEKVLELKPDRIAFYSYAHVPWLKPGQRRYTEKDLPNAALKRSLYECGRNMFEKAGYEETGMDHFALPNDALSIAKYNKKLYRNFMGYTTFAGELLIGLGVSSISDTGGAFAQNEKTVEDYYARIQSYEIPVTKGHILTKEDIILRKHIMSIMCHEETNWNNPDTQCSTINEALPDLLEMEADGLINLKQQGIKVTDTGKPFLRNICMAFDARLQHKKQTNQLFSKSI